MSSRMKMMIPLVGMVVLFGCTVVAVTRHAQELKQSLPQSLGDLSAAKLIEVREAGGQLVLSGTLTFNTERDGDAEGVATLTGADSFAGASGKAEVEVSSARNGVRKQELEVEVKGLAAGAAFSLHVDGQQTATFNADGRGAAELELTSETTR